MFLLTGTTLVLVAEGF